ncbi:MAG: NADH-dependent [FeFe] hydrogenase, group A6 [Planctomycetota bacterium]|jgi:iron-only hydrogenase group A
MINIEVNGRKIEAYEGENLLAAIRRAGIDVPTLCNIDGLVPSGACRVCVVEVEGMNSLVPSCAYPVEEGMKIMTHSPRALRARKTVVELLLAEHPDDCLYCVRSGNCELQTIAQDLGIRERRYAGMRNKHFPDVSSPALERDPAKCILCGKCVRVCEEVQDIAAIDFAKRGSSSCIATAFDEGMNVSSCINCGQCIRVCPTAALREKSSLKEVFAAISDPDTIVVAQHAPAISVTVGEAFGIDAGKDSAGLLTAALRRLGVDRVFDTSFSADLTIMEEASELVERVKSGGKLPMMTSCSPGWIKYVEQYYPEFMDNLSTCKSPQQMMGAIIKSYFAEREGIDPKKIFSFSIMPCVAKKFEAARPEMADGDIADIDAVITTRELIRMIEVRKLDFAALEPDTADTPFGERTTAGKIFGASGGVMEAAYNMLTGDELKNLDIKDVRGLEGIKEAKLDIDGLEVGVAVVNGIGNARTLLEEIKAGRSDIHFIEVMTCPGGCINGGGQPIETDSEAIKARLKGLYALDSKAGVRVSHKNESIQRLYKEYLKKPLGEKSHKLLHTEYAQREVIL